MTEASLYIMGLSLIAVILFGFQFAFNRRRSEKRYYLRVKYASGATEAHSGVVEFKQKGDHLYLEYYDGRTADLFPVSGFNVKEDDSQPREQRAPKVAYTTDRSQKNLPVAHTERMYCQWCGGSYDQERRIFYDPDNVEYRRCTHCKTESEWIVGPSGNVYLKDHRKEDTSIQEYDRKRAAERTYRERRKKGGRYLPPEDNDKEK